MKKILSAALLMLAACSISSVFVSCGDDEEDINIGPEAYKFAGTYLGTTSGSSMHFENLTMPDVIDTVIITVAVANDRNYDIRYKSSYWGEATFENVPINNQNGVDGVMFAEVEGKIIMPKRTPNAEVTYSEYPATLKLGKIANPITYDQWNDVAFTIDANLGERAGIYTLAFTQSR